jgi:hypothetical protein
VNENKDVLAGAGIIVADRVTPFIEAIILASGSNDMTNNKSQTVNSLSFVGVHRRSLLFTVVRCPKTPAGGNHRDE